VGTGYSMSTLEELRQRLLPHSSKWNPKRPPPHLCLWKPIRTDDVPDLVFDPEKSVVLSVGLHIYVYIYIYINIHIYIYIYILL